MKDVGLANIMCIASPSNVECRKGALKAPTGTFPLVHEPARYHQLQGATRNKGNESVDHERDGKSLNNEHVHNGSGSTDRYVDLERADGFISSQKLQDQQERKKSVRFSSDPISAVNAIPSRESFTSEQREELWYDVADYREMANLAQTVCRGTLRAQNGHVLEHAFVMPEVCQEELDKWSQTGHSRRGLELWCNHRHRRDRVRRAAIAKAMVLDGQAEGMGAEDVALAYGNESRAFRDFAYALGAADAVAAKSERGVDRDGKKLATIHDLHVKRSADETSAGQDKRGKATDVERRSCASTKLLIGAESGRNVKLLSSIHRCSSETELSSIIAADKGALVNTSFLRC